MRSPRIIEHQVIHALKGDIDYTYATTGVGLKKLGDLGAGMYVVEANGDVQAAFNAGTTNVLDIVGFKAGSTISATATPDYTFMSSATFAPTAANTSTKNTPYRRKVTDDMEVYVRYSYTGTAPTAGTGTALLSYYPHQDQGA